MTAAIALEPADVRLFLTGETPVFERILFPSGAPDPGASPCIRQRLSVAATLRGVVFQFFRYRLNLSVLAPFAIERAAIVQFMATASARLP